MSTLVETITAQDGTIAELRQHDRHTYSLTIVSRHTGHNRWGTRAEIEQDKEHFIATGTLPRSKQSWF